MASRLNTTTNLSTKSWDNLNFFNCNLMLGTMLKSCQGLMWHFTSHLSIDKFYSFPNHLTEDAPTSVCLGRGRPSQNFTKNTATSLMQKWMLFWTNARQMCEVLPFMLRSFPATSAPRWLFNRKFERWCISMTTTTIPIAAEPVELCLRWQAWKLGSSVPRPGR